MKTLKTIAFATILSIVAFSSCKKDDAGYQPQVVNQVDNFSLHASSTAAVSNYYEYKWSNTGTQADVTIATQAKAAKMDIKVYDANGLEVYSNSLDNAGAFTTAAGVSGQWKIVIVFETFSGNLQLGIKKAI